MRIKFVGIVVFMLIAATNLTVVGIIDEPIESPINNKGGLYRQLPFLPEKDMPNFLGSDPNLGWIVYEDFDGVTAPICHIHWWGVTVIRENDTWFTGDPEGMIFDITFYEDASGKPGLEVFTFEDVIPEYAGTGIFYDYSDNWPDASFELYHFEADLGLCFDLQSGWISIISNYSPSNSILGWIESPDGNSNLYHNDIEREMDVSFILSESGDPQINVTINGGLGVSVDITNIGNETLSNIPVDIVVYGGLLSKTKVNKRKAIDLEPGETKSVKSGLILGFGKIAVGVIADDLVKYTSGYQLLFFTKL